MTSRINRSLLLLFAATLLSGCAALGVVSGLLGNQVVFTPSQLQGFLDDRFPREYDKLGGLVSLRVINPRLSIPAGSHRLRLDFDVGIGAPGRDSRVAAGHLALASGLRFDPGTRGLHLDDPTIESLQLPEAGLALGATGRELVDRWLQDYAAREPVYQFDTSLLQRLQSRRIGATTIDDGMVVVHLDQ
jgi:hypothetical protein